MAKFVFPEESIQVTEVALLLLVQQQLHRVEEKDLGPFWHISMDFLVKNHSYPLATILDAQSTKVSFLRG